MLFYFPYETSRKDYADEKLKANLDFDEKVKTSTSMLRHNDAIWLLKERFK